jgi:superfamily II DNA or RNA helicase
LLRDYQLEDYNAIVDDVVNGETRLLLVWPTGAGKTTIFSYLAGHIKEVLGKTRMGKYVGTRTLILVNRDKLVDQTASTINRMFPHVTISVEQASEYADDHSDVVIAMVQSVGSAKKNELGEPEWKKRLSRFNPDEFGLIIVDEAHNASSTIYRSVLKYFKAYHSDSAYNDPNKILLFVTATPNRTDNQGLEEFVSKITGAYEDPVTGAKGRSIVWAVKNGWLVRPEGHRVNTEVDLDDVSITMGDFNEKELSSKVDTEKRNKIAVDKYIEIANGKKAVAFSVNIEHAEHLAQAFNDRGIRAAAISSRMKKSDCDKIMQAFELGYYRVMVGCDKFTEGFDDPTIEVVMMLRPTKSSRFYIQAVGRGLRPFPSKEALASMRSQGKEPDWIKDKCIIIDYVDNISKHSLMTIPRLFGLSSKLDPGGKDVLEVAEAMQEEAKKLSPSKQSQLKLDEIPDMATLKATIERLDLLALPSVPPEIQRISDLNWLPYPSGYQIGLPSITYALRENSLGGYDAYEINKGLNKYITTFPTLDAAIPSLESKIPSDQAELARANASWRTAKVPPTENQIALLRKAKTQWAKKFATEDKFVQYLKDNVTKGGASDMIARLLAKQPIWG